MQKRPYYIKLYYLQPETEINKLIIYQNPAKESDVWECLDKSNQIESNRIKLNQIESNQIESNRIKSNRKIIVSLWKIYSIYNQNNIPSRVLDDISSYAGRNSNWNHSHLKATFLVCIQIIYLIRGRVKVWIQFDKETKKDFVKHSRFLTGIIFLSS